jgi:hypothetical protein
MRLDVNRTAGACALFIGARQQLIGWISRVELRCSPSAALGRSQMMLALSVANFKPGCGRGLAGRRAPAFGPQMRFREPNSLSFSRSHSHSRVAQNKNLIHAMTRQRCLRRTKHACIVPMHQLEEATPDSAGVTAQQRTQREFSRKAKAYVVAAIRSC